jgi:predicted glycoside hydrolase/deacetylase ChbG (UPF0249 family)
MDKDNRSRHKLVFSADDFGASQKANDNILELVSLRKIDRVAVMMNGKFTDTEIEALLSSGVKLDIHLDAQQKIEQDRKLKAGVFGRIFKFLKNYVTGQNSPQKIGLIWERQIEDFRNRFGRYPDGLNSHQHIHFFPPYFKIALELCRKYDLEFMRFGKLCAKMLGPVSFILNVLKK